MNNVFKGKTVFITGASSGIGKACATQFAQHGAKLILCARRLDRLESLAQELSQKYESSCHLVALDVRKLDAVSQLVNELPPEFKKINILINNAGLAAGLDKLQDADINDWEAMIDTNIKGLLYVSRIIVPLMIEANQGHIVNIGSIAGHQVYPAGSVYCGTKHAVKAITEGLKLDLTGYNIRVTSIDPGMVETEFSQVRFKNDVARANSVYQGFQPLTPDDIADTIIYATSRPAHVNICEMLIYPTAQSSVSLIARDND